MEVRTRAEHRRAIGEAQWSLEMELGCEGKEEGEGEGAGSVGDS
jgi:hypothetical protein